MQGSRLGPAIADADFDQEVLGRRLRVLDEDIKVAVVVEDPGVQQFVLLLGSRAGAVGLD